MSTRRLLTIPISHYCEKVRWALDRLGLPYTEERHLQVFHYLHSFRLSRGPNVPVLVDGATTLSDSTVILKHLERYADAQHCLYPDAHCQEIDELEELFDETLGIESRRWVYFHALQEPASALRTSCQGVPGWQAAVAPYLYPLLKIYISYKLDVSPHTVERGIERSRAIVAQVDARLADGRRYLVGEHFSAADLTLAAMLAPFVMPPEYGVRLPQLDEVSPTMRVMIDEMRATRTGQYVLQLYRTQRRAVPLPH